MKEGWYGLRNRAASELLIDDDERDKLEAEFFEGDEWKSLNDQRLGRAHLKAALIRMRNSHIKRSIPGLVTEIDGQLASCMGRLEYLGEPRTTPTAQFAMINKIATHYSRLASGALDGRYNELNNQDMYARKRIRDDLETFQTMMQQQGVQHPFRTPQEDADGLNGATEVEWAVRFFRVPTYAWIRGAIKGYRALEDSGEVNPEVKSHLWKVQIANWTLIGAKSLSTIERTVDSVNQALFAAACPDKDQLRKLLVWLDDDFRAASNAAKFELDRIIEDENGSVMTYNPRRASKQNELRIKRTAAIKKRMTVSDARVALPQASDPAMNVSHISADLIINSLLHQDPELVGVLSTHDSIAAYHDISLHRFVDNFALQVVERHLLGPSGPLRLFNSEYVTKRLHGEANAQVLNELAGEEPEVAKERAALEKKRASLEEARKRAQGFKML